MKHILEDTHVQHGRQCCIICTHSCRAGLGFMAWIQLQTYCWVIAPYGTLHGESLHSSSSIVLPPPSRDKLINLRHVFLVLSSNALQLWLNVPRRFEVIFHMLTDTNKKHRIPCMHSFELPPYDNRVLELLWYNLEK